MPWSTSCILKHRWQTTLLQHYVSLFFVARWPTELWSSSVSPGSILWRLRPRWRGRATHRTSTACWWPPARGRPPPAPSTPSPGTWPAKASRTQRCVRNNHQPLNISFADAKMKRVAIVSPKEIAKDQGKPLSKYERNMMIFDWLHTLGNSSRVCI